MRVVLDTNVWISALLNPAGAPGRLVRAALASRFEAVVTPHLWQETFNSFSKERIRQSLAKKGYLEEAQFFLFVARSRLTTIHDVNPPKSWVPGDADDDWVIQCALTAKAERIVTGDKAMLDLGAIEGIRIVTPQAFILELGIEG